MVSAQIDKETTRKPLRLWPGVALAVLLFLVRYVLPKLAPEAMLVALLGGFVGALAIFLWWLIFSRAAWSERLGAVALVIAAMALTPRLLHESVAQGNMGFQFFLHAIPILSLAFVAGVVAGRRLSDGPRRAVMAATILLACGVWTLVRSKGITGDGMAELTWRWTETAEERLLAGSDDDPAALVPQSAAMETKADRSGAGEPEPSWPGFRGRDRDGVVAGVRIGTDWSQSPPVELWRRPIGPGVSSFAVRGDLLYTQEQRGDDEMVSCYRVTTGEPVWHHRDEVRFWDSHVGAGPRATPVLADGRVYALGATGILNALDVADGTVVWSRDVAADTEAKVPTWGFVSSPWLAGDVVIVDVGALAAFDLATGEPRWSVQARSYSSPQQLTLDGAPQILLVSHAGLVSVAPADGTKLWEHSWPGIGMMQPTRTAAGDVLFSMADSGAAPLGTRSLSVRHDSDGWTVDERWTSTGLKTAFSPPVVHKGHAFGFDGSILACIDLEGGARKWKGGRYGNGQLLLLPDQDLLLVLTERGEVALVGATPDRFQEIARIPAIEGKTWNQPALAGDVLLIRNGQEMAAFRLPLAGA